MNGVTRRLYITTMWAAIVWVSVSYIIAMYSTFFLGQPFPVVELSKEAIGTLLGVNILKYSENTFEHNDGGIFGKSDKSNKDA
jgi:hypothetical protein